MAPAKGGRYDNSKTCSPGSRPMAAKPKPDLELKARTVDTITRRTVRAVLPSSDTPGVSGEALAPGASAPQAHPGLPGRRSRAARARTPAKPHPPTRATIAQAIPSGSRRPPRWPGFQPAFLAALAADPELAAVRSDFRQTILELARVYARHADWHTMTTWRPRARLCLEVGSSRDPSRPLSVTAYRAARRWLQEHGYLGLVSQGWTSALRAGPLDDGEKVCPVYVLAIPRTPRTRHIPPPRLQSPPVNRALATSRSEVVKAPAHARGDSGHNQGQDPEGPRSARTDCVPQPAEAAVMSKTQIRSEGLAAAQVILSRSRLLRSLSPEHVATVISRFTGAGWAPGDVLYATGHEPPRPDGRCRMHGYAQDVRHPAAWLRYRLSLWTGPDGTPLPALSQRRAAERHRTQAKEAARRAQWQQTLQARATGAAYDTYDRGASAARAMLRGRRPAPPRRTPQP